jgi:lipase chaperone LimK
LRARRAIAAVAGLGALVALGLGIGIATGPRNGQGPRGEGAEAAVASAPIPPAPGEVDAAALPPLPASLRGTEPAGGLRVDASGRFVPGRDALDLFDYYFSASGEEPDEIIRARILAEIRARLSGDAARQAEAFFASYLAYRDLAQELFATEPASDDLERRFQRIREIRREAFGAGVAADLFADEERITEIDLARRRVAQDETLAPDERARRLAALDAELPASEREARTEARQVLDLRAAESALRAAGASPSEIQAERERRVGPEAAARLAALDEQRASWSARVDAYRAERDALRARGASDAEIAELRDSRFAGPERLRIEALERRADADADGDGLK